MRSVLAAITLLSMTCSGALAMGAQPAVTVVVRDSCSIKLAPVTPRLRDWLREQCDAQGRCRADVPPELADFVKGVSATHKTLRERCQAPRPSH